MKFRHRILLDRTVAAPLAFFANGLARVLGWTLQRDHSIDPATTKHIVVSKLVGMGSILQATPLLRALKQRFPQAQLTFVTLESNRCLVERLEMVDEVLCLDDRSANRMLWTTLRTLVALVYRRVDHYFDLEVYSAFAALLTLFSLTRNRLGFYRHSNRFKRGIYSHLIYFNTRMSVRHLYLQLGRVAGIPEGVNDQLAPIRVELSDRLELKNKLSTLGWKPGQSYILVNPNASDLLVERRWPTEHMVAALTRLAELGWYLILMGARSDSAFVQGLHNRVPELLRRRVVNTAGLLSLGEVFALIEGASCVLTNDTGPMHMAFALGKPTVCLFGPGDPAHYCIVGPDVVSLYAPVSCSPCVYEVDEPPCSGNNVCMQRLLPELVVDHVLALLNHSGEPVATRLPLV